VNICAAFLDHFVVSVVAGAAAADVAADADAVGGKYIF
jgi:hypothetical protein